MLSQENLRPLEAVILKLRADGLSNDEVANRIAKRPESVPRFLEMIVHKSDIPEQQESELSLKRPVERVVERLRGEGESYEQIGDRLNRGADHVQRIEAFAEMKDQLLRA